MELIVKVGSSIDLFLYFKNYRSNTVLKIYLTAFNWQISSDLF